MPMQRSVAFASSLALHLLVGLLTLRHAPPRISPPPSSSPRPAITFFVPPADDETFPGLKPLETAPAIAKHASRLTLDRLTFNVAKVADHAHVLFPFLTPGLSWEHLALAPEPDPRERLENPLTRSPASKKREAKDRPLVLGEIAIQAMVDQSWSRRDRWKAFQPILSLANRHSADAGDLPVLLQRYRQQNSLQPYDDTSTRDPRLWAELELAADHVDFIGFLRRYASERGSSKSTTELLFLLDELAQSSQNILDTLLSVDPQQHLARTHKESSIAYDLVVELQRYYKSELARRGLTSEDAISAFYDSVRLRILMGIVNSTPGGYRVNDARFLIGAIHWRQHRTEDALHWWRQLTADPTDSHVSTYAQIIGALQAGGSTLDPDRRDAALKAQIKAILSRDYVNWVGFSFTRLRKFGYSFDTY
jgi:hypothetical protein